MGCLMAGALLLAVGETLAPVSVLGFIAPMWLVGVGIATAVSVAPNAALRGFDHIAGTATAVYFCFGGLLLGIIGTLIITLLSTGTTWPIIAYCLILATAVLCLSCINPNRRHLSQEEHDALALQGTDSAQSVHDHD